MRGRPRYLEEEEEDLNHWEK